jgi:hypothetical protein
MPEGALFSFYLLWKAVPAAKVQYRPLVRWLHVNMRNGP